MSPHTPSLQPGDAAAAAPMLSIVRGVLADPFSARAHRRALLNIGRRAGLSDELAARVASLATRTGLWRSEQLDIARELAAHFADAQAAGTGGANARGFGNDDDAARLIGRAKRRSRPPGWQFIRALLLILLAVSVLLLGTYGVMAYRYFAGTPTLARNVLKELNAPVLQTPEQDRAWPLYIKSVETIGRRPDVDDSQFAWPVDAADPGFAKARDWLASRPEAVPSILAAAAKPKLGYVYSNGTDRAFDEATRRAQGTQFPSTEPSMGENPIAMSILLVPLGHLRTSARIIAADAAVAAQASDGARYVRDIEALYAIAAHAREDRLLISELVGLAIAETAQRSLSVHIGQPGLFTDGQLERLAGLVAGYAGERPVRFDLSHERSSIDDIIQRTYTDNGRGDGRAIRGTLDWDIRQLGYANQEDAQRPAALRPLAALRAPSRAELASMVDDAFRQADADQSLPLRRRGERKSTDAMERLDQQGFQPLTSLGVVPALSNAFLSRDLFEARRDALLVGIALERFRARDGVYPRSLDQLVPEFLAAVPNDPLSDAPIRYRLVGEGSDARPLVYSVFLDASDDQGRAPDLGPPNQEPVSTQMDRLIKSGSKVVPAGDWTLYPPPQIQPTAPAAQPPAHDGAGGQR